jgi:hypothetical protein
VLLAVILRRFFDVKTELFRSSSLVHPIDHSPPTKVKPSKVFPSVFKITIRTFVHPSHQVSGRPSPKPRNSPKMSGKGGNDQWRQDTRREKKEEVDVESVQQPKVRESQGESRNALLKIKIRHIYKSDFNLPLQPEIQNKPQESILKEIHQPKPLNLKGGKIEIGYTSTTRFATNTNE